MKVYADRPVWATNQLLGDLLVLAWIGFWIWAATKTHHLVIQLEAPGKQAEHAGRSLQSSLGDAASKVGDVPVAGDKLRSPFDSAAGSGKDLAAAAVSYQHAVERVALLSAVLVALIPILVLLVLWLPRRIAWIRMASATRRLAASGGAGARDLFALRALVRQPVEVLAKVADDPAAGWRTYDDAVVGALADLELRSLGLRA